MKISFLSRGAMFLLLFLLAFSAGTGLAASSPSSEVKKTFVLVFDGTSLSAEVKEASLEDVLRELAEQTPLSIEVNGSIADEKISALFDPLPLENGLHTLLRNKNYLLMYKEIETDSMPQFVVEGIKVAGKGTGRYVISGSEKRTRQMLEQGTRPETSRINEPEIHDNHDDSARIGKGHLFLPPPPPVPRGEMKKPHDTANVPPRQNQVPRVVPSLPPSLSPPPNPALTDKSVDMRIDALEELAETKGIAALPIFEEVSRSDPDPDVREHAEFLIEDVKEEAGLDSTR